MSTQLQLRRGTAAQTAAFTGAAGEVTVNTTDNSLVVHDGITQGGFGAARKDLNNVENATFYAKGIASGLGGGGSGGSLTAAVSAITKANPGVVTTTAAHGFSDGQQVTFTDVGGMTQLNGNAYYCDVLTSNTFAIYTDPGLTTPLNTTGFGTFTSGGTVTATTAPGAPTTAAYVVITANPTLTNERTLTAGTGLTLQDGGAGGGATLSVNLANTVPSNLGSAAAGVANTASRSDHVHAKPIPSDIGAVPITRYVLVGNGLTGGGNLASNVTISLNAGLINLNDVAWTGNLTNGDALIYNGATGKWYNTQNLPRMTLQSNSANVGLENAVKTLNFTGNGVTSGAIVVAADVDNTKVNITFPEIFTQERVEDIAGAMVTGSTQNGISVTYDDNNGKINYAVNNFTVSLTGAVTGAATVANLSNVTITTQNAPGGINLLPDTVGNYVATLATAVANTIIVTNTAGNTHGAAYTVALNTAATDYIESVQDIASGLLDLNAGARGITATYDDANAKVTLSTNPFTISLTGAVLGSATVSNLGNVTITTQNSANGINLLTDTTGNYVGTLAQAAGNTITVTNSVGNAHGGTFTVALNTSATDYIESVQDISAGLLDLNTGTRGITATYDDANGKVTLSTNTYTVSLTGDVTGSATVSNLGNVSITTQIAANSVNLLTDTSGNYVGTLAQAVGNTITVTNSVGNAHGGTFTVALNTAATDYIESVQDIAAGLLDLNTGTRGITAIYDDANAKVALNVNPFTISLTGDVLGSATVSNLGNVTINTQVTANAINLQSDTVGDYTATLTSAAANTITVTNTAANTHGSAYTVALNTAATDYIESVQDIAAGLLDLNTGTRGITAVYDDANAKVTLSTNPFTVSLTGAVLGSATVSNLGNVTITTQNAANGVNLLTETSGNFVGTLAAAASNTVIVTNTVGNAHGGTFTVALNTTATDYVETVQDYAAGLFDQNTGTRGITAVYDDANAKVALNVNTYTVSLTGDVTGTATVANLGNVSITTQIAANSVALGTDTTGNYVQAVSVSGSGISISPTTAGEGVNAAITISSATNNSANTLVYRDTFGSFAANVITASLTGAASLNVLKAGDTMTGALTLSANPTANLHAATKEYVDSKVSSATFSINTAAGTGSGTLISGDTLTISGGTGITTSLSGDTFTINNNGVVSLSSGPGISISSANGSYTISATGTIAGVSSVNSQTGAVTLQGTTEEIEVDQPSAGIVRIGIPNAVSIVSLSATSVAASTTISAVGNITGGNLVTSGTIAGAVLNLGTGSATLGNIINGNGNGIGNIGAVNDYFNTVFAKATSAQYADLAENYLADAAYSPGTVVKFGGEFEVTMADHDMDPFIAGVVSTNPAYVMNSGLVGEHVVTVALAGRVPCNVIGPVKKGQMMVSAGTGHARAESRPEIGTVIGKALEDFDGEFGVIEVVVGRL